MEQHDAAHDVGAQANGVRSSAKDMPNLQRGALQQMQNAPPFADGPCQHVHGAHQRLAPRRLCQILPRLQQRLARGEAQLRTRGCTRPARRPGGRGPHPTRHSRTAHRGPPGQHSRTPQPNSGHGPGQYACSTLAIANATSALRRAQRLRSRKRARTSA